MRERRSLLLVILILATAAWLACRRPSRAHPKVVLIGLDGASWNVLDPLLKEGVLPHLDALRQRGVTAELGTVEPVDSPTEWTTIGTGRRPAVHGVTSFFATWDFIRVPTIWERLAARGVRVGLYDYLITWPPRTLPGGFVIPGWTRLDGAVTPPDVFARAGVTPYAYSVERLALQGSPVANSRRELTQKPPRWNRLEKAFGIDVGAVTFYSFDLISHRFWRATHPAEFPAEKSPVDPRQRLLLRDTALEVDRAVGEMVDALDPETAVLIASDHGFRARPDGVRRKWSFHSRRWLALAGLVPDRDHFKVVDDWQEMIVRVEPGGDPAGREKILGRLRDLFASAHDAAGSPLFKVDVLHGTDPPREGLPKAFAELVRLGAPAYGWLLARPDQALLERACPDGALTTVGGPMACGALAHVEEFSGAHDPTAVFLAAGGPIRHLAARGRLHVLDLAPLIVYLAGQPIPDDLEGRLPSWILSPAFLKRHPPSKIAVRALPRRSAGTTPEDPELTRRLKSLGYVN
jgi:hypothetical protein